MTPALSGGVADPSSAVCVVLARAGSKGVPGKNTAPLAGRPCVAWTLDDARAARRVGLVALSTDSDELAGIGRSCGAAVVRRPPVLATDTARVDDAARHAVADLEARGLARPGSPVVILYGSVPVRPAGIVDAAIDLLLESGADSVQSYEPVGKHHPWWTARMDGSGRVSPWEGAVLNHGVYRRQELPPAFVPDGGVIAVRADALFLRVGADPGPHAFFGRDRRGVVNAEGSVVDIDEPADLLVAGAVLERRRAAEVA